MNAAPDSDEMRMLTGRTAVAAPKLVFHDAWEVAGDGAGMTWSNDNPYAALDLEPSRRIDYVFAGWPKEGGRGHVVSARVVGTERDRRRRAVRPLRRARRAALLTASAQPDSWRAGRL